MHVLSLVNSFDHLGVFAMFRPALTLLSGGKKINILSEQSFISKSCLTFLYFVFGVTVVVHVRNLLNLINYNINNQSYIKENIIYVCIYYIFFLFQCTQLVTLKCSKSSRGKILHALCCSWLYYIDSNWYKFFWYYRFSIWGNEKPCFMAETWNKASFLKSWKCFTSYGKRILKCIK